MKKVSYILLIVFISMLLYSCVPQGSCSAYGEQQRYQRDPRSWNRNK